jgi:hypothetical protein
VDIPALSAFQEPIQRLGAILFNASSVTEQQAASIQCPAIASIRRPLVPNSRQFRICRLSPS